MKILVAYDGSRSAVKALMTARPYAKVFQATILVVMSLFGKHAEDPEEIDSAQKQLDHAESLIKNEGIICEGHMLIRAMRPGEDIIQFARGKQADLIFIGVKRRSKVGKLVFGSNAQYIILNAPCPVITVK